MTEPSSQSRTPFDWEARFKADDAPWERAGTHPAIRHWLDAGALKPGQRVYVPGCGRGKEPAHLAETGLTVTASDIAPSAAQFQEHALADFPKASVIEANSLMWRPQTPFDRLYEQTFLCAIHPRDRAAYEAMAFEVLSPGGALLALFMQKEERGGPPYGCSPEVMRELFVEERWAWPELHMLKPFPHPGLNNKAELGAILIRR